MPTPPPSTTHLRLRPYRACNIEVCGNTVRTTSLSSRVRRSGRGICCSPRQVGRRNPHQSKPIRRAPKSASPEPHSRREETICSPARQCREYRTPNSRVPSGTAHAWHQGSSRKSGGTIPLLRQNCASPTTPKALYANTARTTSLSSRVRHGGRGICFSPRQVGRRYRASIRDLTRSKPASSSFTDTPLP